MRGTRTYCSSACPLSFAQANRHLLHTITAMGIWASPSRLTYAAENSHQHHQTLDIHAALLRCSVILCRPVLFSLLKLSAHNMMQIWYHMFLLHSSCSIKTFSSKKNSACNDAKAGTHPAAFHILSAANTVDNGSLCFFQHSSHESTCSGAIRPSNPPPLSPPETEDLSQHHRLPAFDLIDLILRPRPGHTAVPAHMARHPCTFPLQTDCPGLLEPRAYDSPSVFFIPALHFPLLVDLHIPTCRTP